MGEWKMQEVWWISFITYFFAWVFLLTASKISSELQPLPCRIDNISFWYVHLLVVIGLRLKTKIKIYFEILSFWFLYWLFQMEVILMKIEKKQYWDYPLLHITKDVIKAGPQMLHLQYNFWKKGSFKTSWRQFS